MIKILSTKTLEVKTVSVKKHFMLADSLYSCY